MAKQLTFHSSDDAVLGWRPDSGAVLFSANRGKDFTPQLYLVSVAGGMPTKAGTDMGVQVAYSLDGRRLAYTPKSQVYWRKFYRGATQSDIVVMDVAASIRCHSLHRLHPGRQPLQSRSDSRRSCRQGLGSSQRWGLSDCHQRQASARR